MMPALESTGVASITSAEIATTTASIVPSETTRISITEISSAATSTGLDTSTAVASIDTTESSTTAFTTTTTSSEPAVTTFNIIAEGGPADGLIMGQRDNMFYLQFSIHPDWKPTALILEQGTGYLRRADPWNPVLPLVCFRWYTGQDPLPGWLVDCSAENDFGGMAHPIKCELKSGGQLSCSTRAGHCAPYVAPRDKIEYDCQEDDGYMTGFYTQEEVSEEDITYYAPWMGFEGFQGLSSDGQPLVPLQLRWQRAD
ncbi:hypothetical protein FBEOM_7890 [Fusarium beomiforme]|uniref:Uncharacterized protein n=1 Tax=Fusarium beomiforme TaxID=44412 RepID=A0A9P5AG90_9HYPO|nr:hypothetical protein FBEOM_7890 [Fusarium beomiforme]